MEENCSTGPASHRCLLGGAVLAVGPRLLQGLSKNKTLSFPRASHTRLQVVVAVSAQLHREDLQSFRLETLPSWLFLGHSKVPQTPKVLHIQVFLPADA